MTDDLDKLLARADKWSEHLAFDQEWPDAISLNTLISDLAAALRATRADLDYFRGVWEREIDEAYHSVIVVTKDKIAAEERAERSEARVAELEEALREVAHIGRGWRLDFASNTVTDAASIARAALAKGKP